MTWHFFINMDTPYRLRLTVHCYWLRTEFTWTLSMGWHGLSVSIHTVSSCWSILNVCVYLTPAVAVFWYKLYWHKRSVDSVYWHGLLISFDTFNLQPEHFVYFFLNRIVQDLMVWIVHPCTEGTNSYEGWQVQNSSVGQISFWHGVCRKLVCKSCWHGQFVVLVCRCYSQFVGLACKFIDMDSLWDPVCKG